MSLADYSGGAFLEEGTHLVTIKGSRFFAYNSGSRGVEFEFTDLRGRGIKHSFCLKDSILWRLAGFAEACGLNKQQMSRIDPQGERGFQAFVGRRLRIVCEKGRENDSGKRYTEVVDWLPAEEVAPPPRIAPPPADDVPPPMTDSDIPADVDEQGIPF